MFVTEALTCCRVVVVAKLKNVACPALLFIFGLAVTSPMVRQNSANVQI